MNSEGYVQESAPQLRDYLGVIRKRIWVIVAIFVIVVTIVAIWSFKTTPTYRATVQILINPSDPKVVNFEEVTGRNLQLAEYYATQYKLLQSRSLATRVVKQLQLDKQEGYGIPYHKEKDNFALFVGTVSGLVRSLIAEAKETRSDNSLTEKLLFTPEERAVGVLLSHLKVEPVRQTRLVNVHFEDPDPAFAAKLVNTLGELYLQMNLELRFSTTREANVWLEKEVEKVRKKLLRSEQALQAYKEKYNIVSLEDRRDIVTQKLAELNTEATKARTSRIALEVVAKPLRNGTSRKALTSLPDVMENPLIQKLKEEYVSLQNEYSALSKRYKARHPKLLRLKSRLDLLEKKISDETHEIAQSILTRYQVALARERSLTRSLEEQKQEALRLNRLSIQYDALKREVDTGKKLYEDILKRTKETGLLEGLKTSNIRIVDRAQVPRTPASPKKARNILIAMGASLFFGVAFVFLLDHFDTRIRSTEEAEAIAGAPVIGAIPSLGRSELKKVRVARSTECSNVLAQEHFRQIRAMAAFRLGRSKKVVQVSSCVPQEGKTFISANMALALADAKKRVLLIDGDIHRASLNEWFRMRPVPGLAQVLVGEANVHQAIRSFEGSLLSVLPAGSSRGISSRLFESSDLRSLVDGIRDDYDYILIDSPPVLAVTDPLIWSQCVDSVFFVLDVQQVNGDMLHQALDKLKELDVPIEGLIMNRLTKNHNYYYYGYNKKYGYYSNVS